MYPKLFLFTRSLLLKNLTLLFFLLSLTMSGQTAVTGIYTDWKGYWHSTGTTGVGNRPDRENNLLAFRWKGTTYSTGVNNAILDANTVGYNAQKFRALKIQTVGIGASMYFLQGSMIDGSASTAVLQPALAGSTATGAELASRLTDGLNGLALGTGVANIKAGTAEFKVGTNNLNLSGIGDGIPDLIVTQVADPGGTADTFKFIDASGNLVGKELSIKFDAVNAVGTYSLDLFNMNGTVGFSPASTRDIRLLGIETSEFEITSTNAPLVDRFVVTFSGNSDCAFIAFNTNSLKIAELSLVNTASLTTCGKAGVQINYTFDIKNTGEVPITNIHLTDLMPGLTVTGNSIASLAAGATETIHGTYTITAADVTAGRVTSSIKVTGTDPSLNVVEDISGNTFTDNIPTTIDLLTPPTISIVNNTTCTSLGSVVLTNLPASGNWVIERSPGNVLTNGSGSSTTIGNLAGGTTYTFRVTNADGCKSPSSAGAAIANDSSTTWNGTAWSNSTPTATKSVVFSGAFTFTSDLTACSCTINSGVNLTIPSGISLILTNGLTVNSGGSLTFENNSSLYQSNPLATNTGNITYKRNTTPVNRYDFTFWSSPVTLASNFTLHDLSPDTLADKYYIYNPSSGWVIDYGGTSTKMVPGEGYNVRAPQTFDPNSTAIYQASFVGVPTNGNVTVNPVGGKWNIVGNPYPSAIDGVKFIQNTDVGAVYFWTHANKPVYNPGSNTYKYATTDYTTFNLTGTAGPDFPGSVTPTGNIGAGQGFFVKSPSGNPIVFTNDMRVAGNNSNFYKTAQTAELERNRLWLNFTNTEGAFKQALVGYIEGASDSWDVNYDAVTLNGNNFIDFYSINEAKKLTIQGRALPFEESDIVPLGYRTTITGEFTIAIDHVDGIFTNQNVYLEDKLTGKIQDLKSGNYTFSTAIGTFSDRFTIRYTNKTLGTGDFETIEGGLLVSVKNKVIGVTSAKENIKEVNIYDISGRLLYSRNKVDSAELSISNLQSSNQVLLVKVTLENDAQVTRKIIFN
ncbi:T9SS sorting signal type C domain-containing protein [Flavobacterium gelatinilyticum]|uniref:T9SS sorting signal type C domain-containing protein n=1 Tax=Flavobacterium gelatinilyticum TaxID=3003260 RepID=UPI0024814268|nr:T9SS sorting signal type C domain-containing protein [Flavobacterium gelatinilyticum]